jgi:predicted unusual protein kinase regulating ubiquinone biosynthesis (AarF/ABC1/UbiB family)
MGLLSGIKFVLYSVYVVCTEYVKYEYNYWSICVFSRMTTGQSVAKVELALTECYNAMVKNIGTKFAATNIYYIKMFQALAYSADFAANDELIAFFRDYTDNVAFTDSEYDAGKLAELSEYAKTVGYELSFTAATAHDGRIAPAKTGSISLVFYGTICKLEQSQPQQQSRSSPIVIKYLRANMRRRVLDSIDDFKYLVWCLNKIPSLRYLHLTDIYNEQRVLMMDQLDFVKEAACIGEFYENCKEMRCVKVPTVYPEFTTKFPNIIVMERIMGKTLDQLDDAVKDHYCHILARGLVKTVFIDGLYHCDLHPGNVIFCEGECECEGDRDDVARYRIAILDFGIIGRLTVDEQDLTYQVFHSFLNKDADRVMSILMESYTEPVDSSREVDRDEPEMRDALLRYMRKMTETVVTCFSADNLCFINKQLIKNNLKIAQSFTKFELSLSVCDNLCKKLAVNRSYLNHLTEIISDVFE